MKALEILRLQVRLHRLGEMQMHLKKVDDTYFKIMARKRILFVACLILKAEMPKFGIDCGPEQHDGGRHGIGSGFEWNDHS